MWIVALGSIDLGHAFVGTFDTQKEAQDWINNLPERTQKCCCGWPFEVRDPSFGSAVIDMAERNYDGK